MVANRLLAALTPCKKTSAQRETPFLEVGDRPKRGLTTAGRALQSGQPCACEFTGQSTCDCTTTIQADRGVEDGIARVRDQVFHAVTAMDGWAGMSLR
jgi:hypothetical protein